MPRLLIKGSRCTCSFSHSHGLRVIRFPIHGPLYLSRTEIRPQSERPTAEQRLQSCMRYGMRSGTFISFEQDKKLLKRRQSMPVEGDVLLVSRPAPSKSGRPSARRYSCEVCNRIAVGCTICPRSVAPENWHSLHTVQSLSCMDCNTEPSKASKDAACLSAPSGRL